MKISPTIYLRIFAFSVNLITKLYMKLYSESFPILYITPTHARWDIIVKIVHPEGRTTYNIIISCPKSWATNFRYPYNYLASFSYYNYYLRINWARWYVVVILTYILKLNFVFLPVFCALRVLFWKLNSYRFS